MLTMEKIRAVDTLLIQLNEVGDRQKSKGEELQEALKVAFRDLQGAAQTLLLSTI
jgi:hypothetical protein